MRGIGGEGEDIRRCLQFSTCSIIGIQLSNLIIWHLYAFQFIATEKYCQFNEGRGIEGRGGGEGRGLGKGDLIKG